MVDLLAEPGEARAFGGLEAYRSSPRWVEPGTGLQGDCGDNIEGLVTDLHAVNSSLVDAGFGAALLCTVIAFTDDTQPLGLVYLYKRGSWYPFAPTGPDRRDTALELQIRSAINQDPRIESDLGRWFPVYGAPGV